MRVADGSPRHNTEMSVADHQPATQPDLPDLARLEVVHAADSNRYELLLDGERVGLADYSLTDTVMTVPHVETNPEHRGKNFAARLMAGMLDDVRAQGLTIVPICPYADAYMRRHPETRDLLTH